MDKLIQKKIIPAFIVDNNIKVAPGGIFIYQQKSQQF